MNDKRRTDYIRGDGETIESYIGRIDHVTSQLEWQSGGHIMWYTHKNPSGCWICEALQICRLLANELMAAGDNPGQGASRDTGKPEQG